MQPRNVIPSAISLSPENLSSSILLAQLVALATYLSPQLASRPSQPINFRTLFLLSLMASQTNVIAAEMNNGQTHPDKLRALTSDEHYLHPVFGPVNLHLMDEIRAKAQNGDAASQLELSTLIFNQTAKFDNQDAQVKKHHQEALFWLDQAARNDNPQALFLLGDFFLTGKQVEKDEATAYLYFRAAAQRGLAVAMHDTAYLLINGIGIKQNLAVALQWYVMAARKGFEPSEQILNKLKIPYQLNDFEPIGVLMPNKTLTPSQKLKNDLYNYTQTPLFWLNALLAFFLSVRAYAIMFRALYSRINKYSQAQENQQKESEQLGMRILNKLTHDILNEKFIVTNNHAIIRWVLPDKIAFPQFAPETRQHKKVPTWNMSLTRQRIVDVFTRTLSSGVPGITIQFHHTQYLLTINIDLKEKFWNEKSASRINSDLRNQIRESLQASNEYAHYTVQVDAKDALDKLDGVIKSHQNDLHAYTSQRDKYLEKVSRYKHANNIDIRKSAQIVIDLCSTTSCNNDQNYLTAKRPAFSSPQEELAYANHFLAVLEQKKQALTSWRKEVVNVYTAFNKKCSTTASLTTHFGTHAIGNQNGTIVLGQSANDLWSLFETPVNRLKKLTDITSQIHIADKRLMAAAFEIISILPMIEMFIYECSKDEEMCNYLDMSKIKNLRQAIRYHTQHYLLSASNDKALSALTEFTITLLNYLTSFDCLVKHQQTLFEIAMPFQVDLPIPQASLTNRKMFVLSTLDIIRKVAINLNSAKSDEIENYYHLLCGACIALSELLNELVSQTHWPIKLHNLLSLSHEERVNKLDTFVIMEFVQLCVDISAEYGHKIIPGSVESYRHIENGLLHAIANLMLKKYANYVEQVSNYFLNQELSNEVLVASRNGFHK